MKIDIFNIDKKYNIIYADPPWSYDDKKCSGNCENHYSTMKLKDICDLPVKNIAADDCVLFLWVTYPMLKEALQVIESWGLNINQLVFNG